jgi:hypothetical protein
MHYQSVHQKVYNQKIFSDWKSELIKTRTVQSVCATQILKLLRVSSVEFTRQSPLIREELDLEVANGTYYLPPVAYSHFLLFLCHFRLNIANEYYNSFRDLQLTISENYVIFSYIDKSNSYNCLGVAYQLIGKRELAEHAFHQAIEILLTWNCALQRL